MSINAVTTAKFRDGDRVVSKTFTAQVVVHRTYSESLTGNPTTGYTASGPYWYDICTLSSTTAVFATVPESDLVKIAWSSGV